MSSFSIDGDEVYAACSRSQEIRLEIQQTRLWAEKVRLEAQQTRWRAWEARHRAQLLCLAWCMPGANKLTLAVTAAILLQRHLLGQAATRDRRTSRHPAGPSLAPPRCAPSARSSADLPRA
jgi:hypothetical protein